MRHPFLAPRFLLLGLLFSAPVACSSSGSSTAPEGAGNTDASDASDEPDGLILPEAGADTSEDGAPDAGQDAADGGIAEGGIDADAADATTPEGSVDCGHIGQACCSGDKCTKGAACTKDGCVPAIRRYKLCGPGSPKVLFLREKAPPAIMTPKKHYLLSVTFANCSKETWEAVDPGASEGYKVGVLDPKDNDFWGAHRFALPADVPPGYEVIVPISIDAPTLTGTYGYGWAVVQERVTWHDTLGSRSPHHDVLVSVKDRWETICPGQKVDVGGNVDASKQVQTCIDATPEGGTLELPPGVYRLSHMLRITKPMTLRTKGVRIGAPGCFARRGPRCAILQASPHLYDQKGMLLVQNTHDVTLEHIVLDGNRSAREFSQAARSCKNHKTRPGYNMAMAGCTHCSFLRGGSARALCGTSLEWVGNQATIQYNAFVYNGDHNTDMMWADGLTLLHSDGAVVTNNLFRDNSDVDFVTGGATNATIQNNTIIHSLQASFAGLMMDNFDDSQPGKFQGADISHNKIDCGHLMCDFALSIGPHAWYLSRNIEGGNVHDNEIRGGKFQIMVEGGGTVSAPVTVTANKFGSSPRSAKFSCGNRPTTAFNVSPDSHVLLGNGPLPTGHLTHHKCP